LYPFSQLQLNEPATLLQMPWSPQTLVLLHSLISLQLTPLPMNPLLQAHLKDPGSLAQAAFASHGIVPFDVEIEVAVTPARCRFGLEKRTKGGTADEEESTERWCLPSG
jgi:hypothetical protein